MYVYKYNYICIHIFTWIIDLLTCTFVRFVCVRPIKWKSS